MESAGERLKKLRLEKGLSLEEVQKKTKIHLNVLKAIEEDSLVNINPVYIKGFLKIYCRFLGVEPKDYYPDYKEIKKESAAYAFVKEEGNISLGQPRVFFGKIVSFFPYFKLKTIFIIILAALSLFGLFKLGKTMAIKHKTALLAQKSRIPAPVVEKIEKKSQKVKNSSRGLSPASVLRLGIHARETCFVTLKSDGKVVFQGNLRKGMSENWQAKEKMELSLSNAQAVDLEVNGRLISKFARPHQAIKNIQITKEEGLVIPR